MRTHALRVASCCSLIALALVLQLATLMPQVSAQPSCGDYVAVTMECADKLFTDFDASRNASTLTALQSISNCTLTFTIVNSNINFTDWIVVQPGASYSAALNSQLKHFSGWSAGFGLGAGGATMGLNAVSMSFNALFGPQQAVQGEYTLDLSFAPFQSSGGQSCDFQFPGDFDFDPATLPPTLLVQNAGEADTLPPIIRSLRTDRSQYRLGDTVILSAYIEDSSPLLPDASSLVWISGSQPPVTCMPFAEWSQADPQVPLYDAKCTLTSQWALSAVYSPSLFLTDLYNNQQLLPEYFKKTVWINITARAAEEEEEQPRQ